MIQHTHDEEAGEGRARRGGEYSVIAQVQSFHSLGRRIPTTPAQSSIPGCTRGGRGLNRVEIVTSGRQKSLA